MVRRRIPLLMLIIPVLLLAAGLQPRLGHTSVALADSATPGVTLYADINYGGSSVTITQDTPDLFGLSFNDIASSLRVTGERAIAVYSDVNYGGSCSTFLSNQPTLSGYQPGNEAISSVKVGSSCTGYVVGNAMLTSLKVITGSSSDIQCPGGYTRNPQDLNQGAGGDYVYACLEYGARYTAHRYTDMYVEQDLSDSAVQASCTSSLLGNSSNEFVPGNLNSGTGSITHLEFCLQTNTNADIPEEAVTDIAFLSYASSDDTPFCKLQDVVNQCNDGSNFTAACTARMGVDWNGWNVGYDETDLNTNAGGRYIYLCYRTSFDVPVVSPDLTLPTTYATSSPGANAFGWYNTTPVSVALSADDGSGGTGIAGIYYAIDDGTCNPTNDRSQCTAYDAAHPITFSSEGVHTIYYYSRDNSGNNDILHTKTIRIDLTKPSISGSPNRAANSYGWYNAPVTVHFTCSDPNMAGGFAGSGIPATDCGGDATLTEGAAWSVIGTATDRAGNSNYASVGPINIDTTKPVVSFSGNAGNYTIDQMVSITCSATDPVSNGAQSGIDTSQTSCPGASGPAYTFTVVNWGGTGGAGNNSLQGTAQDQAGNSGSGSATFTVRATFTALCTLATRFSTDPSVAASLCAKTTSAAQQQGKGNNKNAGQSLDTFIHQVQVQTNKAFTVSQAAVLTNGALALK